MGDKDFRGEPRIAGTELQDRREPRPVVASRVLHEGRVFDLVSERVDLGEAGEVEREYLRHPGAVAVVALDADERVALVQQYRVPVGALAWEIPAGLLDVAGEDPADAARRELLEEADLRAERWDVLVDYWTTPGGSDEAIRIYLARDLSLVAPEERHERTAEEAGMPTAWVALDEARDAVLAGRVHNPSTALGLLAACAARDAGWRTLRPVGDAWPDRPRPGAR